MDVRSICRNEWFAKNKSKPFIGINPSEEAINQMNSILSEQKYNSKAILEVWFRHRVTEKNPRQILVFPNPSGAHIARNMKHKGYGTSPVFVRELTLIEYCEVCLENRFQWWQYGDCEELVKDEKLYIPIKKDSEIKFLEE